MAKETSIKMFYKSGWEGLHRLEEEVNDWLDDADGIEVISMTPNMCTVGDTNEMYQGMTITLWYRYVN